MRCTRTIILTILVFYSLKSSSQNNSIKDTTFIGYDTLVITQNINTFWGYPLLGENYSQKSILHKIKNKWVYLLDTIFNSRHQFEVITNYYSYGKSVVKLVNSYERNPYSDAEVRFSYFVVVDSIHIANSFSRINGIETNGQYWIGKQSKNIGGNSTVYLNTWYDKIKQDSLELNEFGLKLKFDKSTKFLKEIDFDKTFFERLAPNIISRFRKILFLSNGKFIKIE